MSNVEEVSEELADHGSYQQPPVDHIEGLLPELDSEMAKRPGSLPVIRVEGDFNANILLDQRWSSVSNPQVHLVPRREGRIVLPKRYRDVLEAHKQRQFELRTALGNKYGTVFGYARRESQESASQASSHDNELSDSEGTLKARKHGEDGSKSNDQSDSEGTLKARHGPKSPVAEPQQNESDSEGTLKARHHRGSREIVESQENEESQDVFPSQEDKNPKESSESPLGFESQVGMSSHKQMQAYMEPQGTIPLPMDSPDSSLQRRISQATTESQSVDEFVDSKGGSDIYESHMEIELEGMHDSDKMSLDSSQDRNNNELGESQEDVDSIPDGSLDNSGLDDSLPSDSALGDSIHNGSIHGSDLDGYKTDILTRGRWSERMEDLDLAMKWIRQEVIQIKQEDRFLMRRLLDLRAQMHRLMGMPQHLSLSSNLTMLGSYSSNLDVATWNSFMSLDERALGTSGPAAASPMTLKELLKSFQEKKSPPDREDFSGEGTLGRGLRGFGAGLGDLSRSVSTRETIRPTPRIKRKNSLPMAVELEEDRFFDDDDD